MFTADLYDAVVFDMPSLGDFEQGKVNCRSGVAFCHAALDLSFSARTRDSAPDFTMRESARCELYRA